MKIIHNKFLIISTILLSVGVYLYFSGDFKSKSFVQVAYGSSLESSVGGTSSTSTPTPSSGDISSDTAFLASLMSLKDLKIDVSLFSNKSFMALQNNSIKIEEVTPGRKNPFSPIDTSKPINVIAVPKVVTDQPTGITDKSAILNGTINSATGVTDTYFEYGSTAALGTVTQFASPSLVGTFIKNVLGLTPKTGYFFKSCAKINNVATCGDVVSFTTK